MKLRALLCAALVLPALPLVAAAGAATADASARTVLLRASDGRWWSEPITGGAPTLTTIKGSGLLSPDGTMFALTSQDAGKPRLSVVRSDGTDARTLVAADHAEVYVLRWDPTSTRLLLGAYASHPLEWIDVATGVISPVAGRAPSGAQDLSPDLRLGVDGSTTDRRIHFVDRQTALDAGSVADADNFGLTDPNVDDPDLAVSGSATWSASGTRIAVTTTQTTREEGEDSYSASLSLVDLASRTESSYYGGPNITVQFSPDGASLCWGEHEWADDSAGAGPYLTVTCATSSLAHVSKLTLPTPGPMTGFAFSPSAPLVLDSRHGRISKLTGSARPSAIETTGTVTAGDGAGQIVVLNRGKQVARSPRDGVRSQLTIGGHVVFSKLPPSSTWTVTTFPRSWAGALGTSRSVTVTTPKLAASQTTVRAPRGKGRIVVVSVHRAYDGRPLANAHVTLSGQAQPYLPEYAPSGPFTSFAHVVTDAQGQVRVKVPGTFSTARATTVAGPGWSASTSTAVEL